MDSMQRVNYTDSSGIKRRVLMPKDSGIEPSEGIPVSMDIWESRPDLPLSFVIRLTDELWARDLVEPADFLRKDSPDKIRSAILSAIKLDTMDLMAFAKENH